MISFEFHLEKWHEKTLETVAALGFSGPISFSVLLVGGQYRTRTCDPMHVKHVLIPAELTVQRGLQELL